jgi:ketosteroid isomerase-like protein
MNSTELADVEACRNLILDFASRIDNGQTQTLGELLTPDASFARPTVPDVVIQGADNIVAAFAARPKTLISQHLNLNIRIHITGPNTAEGQSIVMLFLSNTAEEFVSGKGRKAGSPLLGTWTDTFVRTKDGWRLKDRRGNVTLHT